MIVVRCSAGVAAHGRPFVVEPHSSGGGR